MTFTVPVEVRGYELDTQGHLNQAVYLQYAEHARWETLRAAGVEQDKLIASGVGPVTLQNTIKYLRELRGGDQITVSCAFSFADGKTFTLHQELRKLDGTLAADVTSVVGLLDLTARKLVPNPAEHFRAIAGHPEVLGLQPDPPEPAL